MKVSARTEDGLIMKISSRSIGKANVPIEEAFGIVTAVLNEMQDYSKRLVSQSTADCYLHFEEKGERDRRTGTRQWSDHSFNISKGCSHGCLYCYARGLAQRFKRIGGVSQWTSEIVNPAKVSGANKRFSGKVMFPTAHDITPALLPDALLALRNLLQSSNEVLIVSKPHLSIIQCLCADLEKYRDQMEFRFTIGSMDAATCALWEPGAPPPEERIESLRHAYSAGYKTSVSMEPMLEGNDGICALVNRVDPFVTSEIWLGKLNGGIPVEYQARPDVRNSLARIRAGQSDPNIIDLWRRLKSHPKICWKDSIREVLDRNKDSLEAQTSTNRIRADHSPNAAISNAGSPPMAKPNNVAPDKALSPAQKAWVTMRARYTPEQISQRAKDAAQKRKKRA